MAQDLLKDGEGRFFRGNLHCHSNRSDGLVDPEAVVAYRNAGYDFICLSDHFETEFGWQITDTRSLRDDNCTTIKVNSTADLADASINGTCAADSPTGNVCTLRAAIQASNATTEKEIIAFDIPCSGVKTISPGGLLPSITEPVIIDAYGQPGASPNTLAVGDNALWKVELDGSEARGGALIRGLTIRESSDSLIRGLAINGFSGEDIYVFGDPSSGATIANNNHIECNYIGMDRSGTANLGNDLSGVSTSGASDNNAIGGSTAGAGNLISGNDGNGVAVEGP